MPCRGISITKVLPIMITDNDNDPIQSLIEAIEEAKQHYEVVLVDSPDFKAELAPTKMMNFFVIKIQDFLYNYETEIPFYLPPQDIPFPVFAHDWRMLISHHEYGDLTAEFQRLRARAEKQPQPARLPWQEEDTETDSVDDQIDEIDKLLSEMNE